jgi:hypothetical protein
VNGRNFTAPPTHRQADDTRIFRARDGAIGTKIRIQLDRQARTSIAIAGIGLFAFAVAVFATALRSGPDVPASATAAIALQPQVAPARESNGAPGAETGMEPAGSPEASPRRSARAACRECGVVASTRQVEPPLLGDGLGHIEVWLAQVRLAEASGQSPSVPAQREAQFETRVRLRDGSTALVTEATPRDWRAGSRVIVIAGTRGREN